MMSKEQYNCILATIIICFIIDVVVLICNFIFPLMTEDQITLIIVCTGLLLPIIFSCLVIIGFLVSIKKNDC